jgi:RNA polymerase sigma-70 factor (ECF subfamily)
VGPASAGDERELVERSRAGDRAAFEELVRRHADRLYAVVLRFVADADEAEDVTQEAFLRAWRNIGRFEGRSRKQAAQPESRLGAQAAKVGVLVS